MVTEIVSFEINSWISNELINIFLFKILFEIPNENEGYLVNIQLCIQIVNTTYIVAHTLVTHNMEKIYTNKLNK